MRVIRFTLSILLCATTGLASEIREFDIKTIERLGNELTRLSQTPQRGATTPQRKRAKQTAMVALKGRLYNIHYHYVVLDDPDGSGFLVYALGYANPGEVVLAGHFRVTVSADGGKAERIDALSRSLDIARKGEAVVKGYQPWGLSMSQIVSSKPVETAVYISNLTKLVVAVATPPKDQVWFIENGKIRKADEKKK